MSFIPEEEEDSGYQLFINNFIKSNMHIFSERRMHLIIVRIIIILVLRI